MKLLILTNNFSGLYSFRVEVVTTLIKRGYNVTISAPYDEKTNFFQKIGCELINTGFNRKGTNPIRDFGLLLFYIKILRQVKPTCVLSYTIKPNIYGGMACRICGVTQIANITGLGSAVENPGWLQKLTVFLYKFGLRRAKTVFFQNTANMDFGLSHGMVCRKSVKLIPGSGVNLQYHQYQEYPKNDSSIRFVFISRLLKEKGIEEYFEAAIRIKNKYLNTEFHVLGTCEEAYDLKLKDLQTKGIIIYHGQQADVRPFIGSAHCTVHPSFYPEGMSNVLLESCAAGRPIITTDRPGCGEIVEDGINGFVVKQQNIDDLVAKLEQFISLPYSQKIIMGKNARSKVEREFDRQIVVNSYLKELDLIANV